MSTKLNGELTEVFIEKFIFGKYKSIGTISTMHLTRKSILLKEITSF